MATLSPEQINNVILNNPNKKLVEQARDKSASLRLHILGEGMDGALSQSTYFENDAVFGERNADKTSNKDLYARLFAREKMVFTAKGGAAFYSGLNDQQTQKLDAQLDTIRFGMPIRKWIEKFALLAYRCDPMGVLFVETDPLTSKPYPTYKSTDSVYDYITNGRKIEYCCFRLKLSEAKALLAAANLPTTDTELAQGTDKYSTTYFRLVDDVADYLIKSNGTSVTVLDTVKITAFKGFPGLIASDIIDFTYNQNFLSPAHDTVELAGRYLNDRSIRDLSKKYAGFPKAFEPLLTCGTCNGTGLLGGKACPSCTEVPNQQKGSGFKLRTKVADVARFPLPPIGQTGGVTNPSALFGYITPDITTWDKQDTSLNDIESAMNDTYWGTTNKQSTTGPTEGEKHAFKETATKTLSDLQPIYTRLNTTADWAENTENELCNFVGRYMFASFKDSNRTYGRYYILETPDELMEQYLDMKTKNAPQSSLFDTLRKYWHSVYANDPIKLAIQLKMIQVEPFVHNSVSEVLSFNPSRADYFSKMFYSEWLATKDDNWLLVTKVEAMQADLLSFVAPKMIAPEESATPPVVSTSIRTT